MFGIGTGIINKQYTPPMGNSFLYSLVYRIMHLKLKRNHPDKFTQTLKLTPVYTRCT